MSHTWHSDPTTCHTRPDGESCTGRVVLVFGKVLIWVFPIGAFPPCWDVDLRKIISSARGTSEVAYSATQERERETRGSGDGAGDP